MYIDKSYSEQLSAEYAIHGLDQMDLEVLLSALTEQAGRSNRDNDSIPKLQKDKLTILRKLLNYELDLY